jgi:uncharacterized membrane protein HdeD (DUF308 family)
MNDELQSKLVEVLTGISEGVSQAKDFAIEQLPDVAQQYIMFGMVWETTLLVIYAVLITLIAVGIWRLWVSDNLEFEAGAGLIVFGGFSLVGLLIAFVNQLKPVLLVWFAPKLYLLQGIAGLVK